MKRKVRNMLLWAAALAVIAVTCNYLSERQMEASLGAYTQQEYTLVYEDLSRVYYPNLHFENDCFVLGEGGEGLKVEKSFVPADDLKITVFPSDNGDSLSVQLSLCGEGEYSCVSEEWYLQKEIGGSWYHYGVFRQGALTAEKGVESEEESAYLSVPFRGASLSFDTTLVHAVPDFNDDVSYWTCGLEKGKYRLVNSLFYKDGKRFTVGAEFTV